MSTENRPRAGGCYIRDPKTGKLERARQPAAPTSGQEPPAKPASAPATPPAVAPKPDKKESGK